MKEERTGEPITWQRKVLSKISEPEYPDGGKN
jgi:hypothetical protein